VARLRCFATNGEGAKRDAVIRRKTWEGTPNCGRWQIAGKIGSTRVDGGDTKIFYTTVDWILRN